MSEISLAERLLVVLVVCDAGNGALSAWHVWERGSIIKGASEGREDRGGFPRDEDPAIVFPAIVGIRVWYSGASLINGGRFVIEG